MMMCRALQKLLFTFCAFGCWLGLSAQEIPLVNGGLEAPHNSKFIMPGWQIFGKGATPDILPGQWEVQKPPVSGRSYVGLIAREDGTREGIYQALPHSLEKGTCYYLTIALSRDKIYSGFNLPLALRLKGRFGIGGDVIPLATSPMVMGPEWVYYTLEFTPTQSVDHLIFEASYAPGARMAYRGNILIDNISNIKPCLRASL